VTPQPLESLPITDKPLKVSKSDIAKRQKTWSSEDGRLEMEGGADKVWTNESSKRNLILTTSYAGRTAPQTVYRIFK
jgi:hypothetical protein